MTHPTHWRATPDSGRDHRPDQDHDAPRPHDAGETQPAARPNAAGPDAPPAPAQMAAAPAAPAAPRPGLDPLADPNDTQPSLPAVRAGSPNAPAVHPSPLQIDPLTSGPLNIPAHGVPTAAAPPTALWHSPKKRPGVKLLIVENEYSNLRLMEHILGLAGYDCVSASNGREALDVFERERPDLVLTEIAMPIMDGLEATAALRARPDGARIPIVGVSAFAMPGDRERALYGGCNAYLTKPYRPQELVDLVERLLEQ